MTNSGAGKLKLEIGNRNREHLQSNLHFLSSNFYFPISTFYSPLPCRISLLDRELTAKNRSLKTYSRAATRAAMRPSTVRNTNTRLSVRGTPALGMSS
jgi:hypothetical protein